MRLMSYIRKHPKTGIFWYRRSVPPALRQHLPVVPGFDHKPGRIEFTKTLGTRKEAEANRLAAQIDTTVQAALNEAEERLAKSLVGDVPAASEPVAVAAPSTARQRQVIKPADLFAASDRWKVAEIERLEIATLNGESTDIAGDDSLGVHGRYNIQQAADNPRNGTWKNVPQFDELLVLALSTVEVDLSAGHPALPRVRADFARAWYEILDARDKMRSGVWEFGSVRRGRDTAPDMPSVKQPTKLSSPNFLFKINDWKASLTMKQRQAAVSETDVRQFAVHLGAVPLDQVKRVHGQKWVETLAKEWTTKTINRKLSALRNYWNYLQAHELVPDDQQPFSRLRIPKIDGIETKEFSKQELVDIWNWVKSGKRAKAANYMILADAIQIAAFTGARLESIFQMNIKDQVIVEDIVCFRFYDKTEAGKRIVPIHSAIAPLIKRLVKNPQSGGFLLPSTASNKYDERGSPAGKRFGYVKTNLKFNESYRFHSIRKTVATILERAECPEGVAADILGHDKPTQTFGLYSGGASEKQKKDWLEKALIYPDDDFMRS
jgi:integrase